MKNTMNSIAVYQNRYETVRNGSGGIIHGFVGNMVHRSLLDGLSEFELPNCARFVDDQWMSIYYYMCKILIKPSGIEAHKDIFAVLENDHEKVGVDSLAALKSRGDYIQELSTHYKVQFQKGGQIAPAGNKIMLITMVKNEEKVLERLIHSSLFCVDAILVSDTGSTDKTCEIAERFGKELTIPVHLAKSEWKNFGHNRTRSFVEACVFCRDLGWDPKQTWGLLLDGDMILNKGENYDKDVLDKIGYLLIQKSGTLDYYNTRLVRISDQWKCVGVTHEYWGSPGKTETLKDDFLWIKDIGDGGCKSDKFERDIRLLTQGIEDEPKNVRYYFYLAQSYKDVGNHKKSIKLYKKRIALGGWVEEVWYSHYMIATCWKILGDIEKAEMWGNKAYNFHRSRAEPLYLLTKMFREKGQNFKAYHYYRLAKNISYPDKSHTLFIEKNIYDYLLDYEFTILQYYVQPKDRTEGAIACAKYLKEDQQLWGNVLGNYKFYIPRLCKVETSKYEKLQFVCPDTDFKPSSISLLKYNGRLMANVRFVNYIINPNGSYNMRENGVLNPRHSVRTKNGFVFFGDDLKPVSELIMMKDDPGMSARKTNIRGLEDVRLFEHLGEVYYTAVTKEFAPDDRIRIAMGRYDFRTISYRNSAVIMPPTATGCEKNWIVVSRGKDIDIIYKWHPLEIGKVVNGKLQIITSHSTPHYFHSVRGSSNPIEFDNNLWCVTHSVVHSTPRKYYHNVVVLEKNTYKLVKYSLPFCFTDPRIEYCLGFVEMNGNFLFTFSVHDSNPHIVSVSTRWFIENMMGW